MAISSGEAKFPFLFQYARSSIRQVRGCDKRDRRQAAQQIELQETVFVGMLERFSMRENIPESVVFVCDDAAILSPMCAAVFLAFSGGRTTVRSAASKKLKEIKGLAAAACREFNIEINNHRRFSWRDDLLADTSIELVVAVTPGAQHVVLEATRDHHIEVEYWPLPQPHMQSLQTPELEEKELRSLLEAIRNRIVDRFGIGSSWDDVVQLPGVTDDESNLPETQEVDETTQAEKIRLTRENLQKRSAEISLYLESLRLLIEDKIDVLSSQKPNDAVALEEWQTWMDFLLSLQTAVGELARTVNEATSRQQDIEVAAEKTQSALDIYKRNFLDWPRSNVNEVVDGTFRASLVGCCAVVGGLFGQPIAGALIGSAIFGGPKVGKAIGDAIKSGTTGPQ